MKAEEDSSNEKRESERKAEKKAAKKAKKEAEAEAIMEDVEIPEEKKEAKEEATAIAQEETAKVEKLGKAPAHIEARVDCSRYTIKFGCTMMEDNGCSWSAGECHGRGKATNTIPGVGGHTHVAVAMMEGGNSMKLACSMYDSTGEDVCLAMKAKGCSWVGGKCIGSITETSLSLLSADGSRTCIVVAKIVLLIMI